MKLDQRGKVLAEYIWIDGSNGLRNKTKVCKLQLSLLPLVVWSVEHVYCPLENHQRSQQFRLKTRVTAIICRCARALKAGIPHGAWLRRCTRAWHGAMVAHSARSRNCSAGICFRAHPIFRGFGRSLGTTSIGEGYFGILASQARATGKLTHSN